MKPGQASDLGMQGTILPSTMSCEEQCPEAGNQSDQSKPLPGATRAEAEMATASATFQMFPCRTIPTCTASGSFFQHLKH